MSTALEIRKQRMREAGIPIPTTEINENAGTAYIPITSQNMDKHARLQALKSGANKQQVQELIKAKGSQSGFQAIPESPMKKRPNNHPGNQVSPDKKVMVQDFSSPAPRNSELSAIEALYGDSPNAGYSQQQYFEPSPMVQNNSQPELDVQVDGYGPSFNPQAMLADKRAQLQKGNPYMQYAVQPENQAATMPNYQAPQNQMPAQQQAFNFEYMQHMMQEIAKNTISEVLNSYTEKQKNKLMYENVPTKDGTQVIKLAQDGKYYKLVPVKIKQG